jgi:DNA-binding response OmpR family regulator
MNILLVEDDVGIGRFISHGLRARGLTVHWERVGKRVRSLAAEGRFNTIILDLLLPDSDGLELCSEIRKAELGIPILVLTARTGLDDRLDGFSAGADDYLAKPFAFLELVARVQALLKRDRLRKPDPILLGPLAMLMVLARARGEIVSRGTLLDEIWGDDIVTDNALDACASALRRSLASVTDQAVVEAVRGQGYALRVSGDGGQR